MVDDPDIVEQVGPLLTRLRQALGLSQNRLADKLCHIAGTPTVTRHEVSRWERGGRVPGRFWRPWLAVVLDTPLGMLEAAVAVSRPQPYPLAHTRPWRETAQRLWEPATSTGLLAMLDHASIDNVPWLAHTWLAGPPDHTTAPSDVDGLGDGTGRDLLETQAARLRRLRRADDLVAGRELARRVDRRLRETLRLLRTLGNGPLRPQTLAVVAGYAQLGGWVHTDAGNHRAARRAYQVALRAATAGGDRLLAAHVLGSLSCQSLATANPTEALLLARTGLAGTPAHGSGSWVRVLLLHRVALAAAHTGQPRHAEQALAQAHHTVDRCHPDLVPEWLYWLDQPELSAMTGRCLAVLGRPLRAVPLLTQPRTHPEPRTTTLYQVWLARSYLHLGELEHACHIAAQAWTRTLTTGSTRAATAMRHLHPLLLHHHDHPAVRDYQRRAEPAIRLLTPDPHPHRRPEPGRQP